MVLLLKKRWGFQQEHEESLGPEGNFAAVGTATCIP